MAKSFLKWAGGKTRYARFLADLQPPGWSGTYREPFMGSGALFFFLEPARAVLSDTNADLVICFQMVRDRPHEVMGLLDEMPNNRGFYEVMRSCDSTSLSAPGRAARVIYLNKTGFRGLWRVNRRGIFNTPYGDYQRPYYNEGSLLDASRILQGTQISRCDYLVGLESARPGDWVYLDPPYVPTGAWGDFTRYTADQFGPFDHERLAQVVRDLTARGVFVLLTNSDTPVVRGLYEGCGLATLSTRRDIDLRSQRRQSTDLVVANYLSSSEMRRSLELAS